MPQVDLDECWREDGFIVGFERRERRAEVLKIAREFQQGAIYEYIVVEGALRRRTLGATLEHIDEETPMKRIDYVALLDGNDLMRWEWAGPENGGIINPNKDAPISKCQ